MQNSSDLDHFKLKMPQKCITFEPKLRFTKFKGLNRSEFHQKLEFSSTFSIFAKKGGRSPPPPPPTCRPGQRHGLISVHNVSLSKLFALSRKESLRKVWLDPYLTFGLTGIWNQIKPLLLLLLFFNLDLCKRLKTSYKPWKGESTQAFFVKHFWVDLNLYLYWMVWL